MNNDLYLRCTMIDGSFESTMFTAGRIYHAVIDPYGGNLHVVRDDLGRTRAMLIEHGIASFIVGWTGEAFKERAVVARFEVVDAQG